jgi:hypothetical protein
LSSPSRAALRSWVTNMAPTFTVRPATWRWCHRPPQLAAVRHRRMGRPRAATVTCFDPLCPLCPLVDRRTRQRVVCRRISPSTAFLIATSQTSALPSGQARKSGTNPDNRYRHRQA